MMKQARLAGLILLPLLGLGTLALAAPLSFEEDMKKSSIDQLVSKAHTTVKASRKMLAESFALLKESIKSNKATEVNARRDAITIMRGLLKVSEENYQTMQAEATEGNRDAVEREYVKIALANRRIAEYYAEVKSVAGTLNLQVAVQTDMTFLGALPPDSSVPSQFIEVDVIPDPPVFASPYM